MAVVCARCGREYDVTLFAFGRTVDCVCGALVDAREPRRARAEAGNRRRRERMAELARAADRVSRMILSGRVPRVDVDIAIERLRDDCDRLFPGRADLFEMVYEARFRRLREQWPAGPSF
jgi:hypothetical protein